MHIIGCGAAIPAAYEPGDTMATVEKVKKVRIVWNGQGGELDSVVVDKVDRDEYRVADALIKMVTRTIVEAGDSFVISAAE